MSFFTDPSTNRSSFTSSPTRLAGRQDFALDNRSRDRFADSLEQAFAKTDQRAEPARSESKDAKKPEKPEDARKDEKLSDKGEALHADGGKVTANDEREGGGHSGQQSDQHDEDPSAAAVMLHGQPGPVAAPSAPTQNGSAGFVDMRKLEQVDRMAAAIAEIHQATGADAQLTVNFGAAIPLAEGAVLARNQVTGEISIQLVGLHASVNTGESTKLAQSLRRQLELREVKVADINMGQAERQPSTGKNERSVRAS